MCKKVSGGSISETMMKKMEERDEQFDDFFE
jgi:hypothetical protein